MVFKPTILGVKTLRTSELYRPYPILINLHTNQNKSVLLTANYNLDSLVIGSRFEVLCGTVLQATEYQDGYIVVCQDVFDGLFTLRYYSKDEAQDETDSLIRYHFARLISFDDFFVVVSKNLVSSTMKATYY